MIQLDEMVKKRAMCSFGSNSVDDREIKKLTNDINDLTAYLVNNVQFIFKEPEKVCSDLNYINRSIQDEHLSRYNSAKYETIKNMINGIITKLLNTQSKNIC